MKSNKYFLEKLDNKIKLLAAILLCVSSGIIGSIFTMAKIPTWYVSLNKPFFNPPNWIFGPVWTILYITMGIALFLVWKQGINKKTLPAIKIFALQLALNFVWSPVFFSLQSPLIALGIIAAMWTAIVLTIIKFYRLDKNASYLLVPYLLWVTFASILNFSIVVLN